MKQILEKYNKLRNAKIEIDKLNKNSDAKPLILNFTEQHKGLFINEMSKPPEIINNNIIYTFKPQDLADDETTFIEWMFGKLPKLRETEFQITVKPHWIECYTKSSICRREIIIIKDDETKDQEKNLLRHRLEQMKNLNLGLYRIIGQIEKSVKMVQTDHQLTQFKKNLKDYKELLEEKIKPTIDDKKEK